MNRVKAPSGLFITFEGVEGCGKTTQARLLARYLRKRLKKVILTKEPGGVSITTRIRRMLLDPGNTRLVPLAELFLYLADRAQHVQELIRPVLASGSTVVCDRYTDASVAYQGVGRNIGFAFTRKLNKIATAGLVPHLTFVLDMPPREGLRRASGRRRLPDRMEKERAAFYERVRKAYLQLAKAEKKRVKVIDGTLPKRKIHEQIVGEVERVL